MELNAMFSEIQIKVVISGQDPTQLSLLFMFAVDKEQFCHIWYYCLIIVFTWTFDLT